MSITSTVKNLRNYIKCLSVIAIGQEHLFTNTSSTWIECVYINKDVLLVDIAIKKRFWVRLICQPRSYKYKYYICQMARCSNIRNIFIFSWSTLAAWVLHFVPSSSFWRSFSFWINFARSRLFGGNIRFLGLEGAWEHFRLYDAVVHLYLFIFCWTLAN